MAHRRRCAALHLATLAGLLGAPVEPALAARLPDWAEAIAAAAPALETGISKHDGRVLYRERRIEVQPDGTWIERVRVARQALTARSEAVGIDYFPFDERARIRVSRAWHQAPGERAERSRRSDQLDIVADDAFITDAKRRLVGIAGIGPGSLVFFEFEATVEPLTLATFEVFADDGPMAVARLEVVTPAGWTLHSEWMNAAEVAPARAGTTTTWELRDLPAADAALLAPSVAETAPRLAVAIEPPAGTSVRVPSAPDWPALAAWFEGLASGTDEVTPEIRVAAERITRDAGTTPEKIHAISRFVRDGVRYTARLVGEGGYRPERAAETLRTLHGECKAKATLTRSLLAAAGIPSHPVLVDLSRRGTVPHEVAVLGVFDHMIVAVPLEAADAEAMGPAVADGGDLGTLAIVDATDEYTAIGWLSEGLSGKEALVLAPGRGRLVTLPGRRPDDHRIERRIAGDLRPGNMLAMEMTTRAYGAPAAIERMRHRTGEAERRNEQERALRGTWLDARLARYEVEAEAEDGAFVETVAWTMPLVESGGVPPHVRLFAGAADGVPRPPLAKRTAPVSYGYPRRLSTEVRLRGFPATTALPSPEVAEQSGWSSRITSSRDDATIHAHWLLVIERTDYPVEQLADLRRLYAAIASASGTSVAIGR